LKDLPMNFLPQLEALQEKARVPRTVRKAFGNGGTIPWINYSSANVNFSPSDAAKSLFPSIGHGCRCPASQS
jgi:hypothetical protein